MTPDDDPAPPLFSAVTSSGRQVYALLKCCGFEPRAQVRFSQQGLMVTVEGSHVMQGLSFSTLRSEWTEPNWLAGAVFINKELFSSYSLNLPPPPPPPPPPHNPDNDDDDDGDDYVEFSISLAVLLECLQIFGGAEAREAWRAGASGAHGGGSHGPGGAGSGAGPGNSSTGNGRVFDQTVLRIGGTCRFSYRGQGHPLHLTYVAIMLVSQRNTA